MEIYLIYSPVKKIVKEWPRHARHFQLLAICSVFRFCPEFFLWFGANYPLIVRQKVAFNMNSLKLS